MRLKRIMLVLTVVLGLVIFGIVGKIHRLTKQVDAMTKETSSNLQAERAPKPQVTAVPDPKPPENQKYGITFLQFDEVMGGLLTAEQVGELYTDIGTFLIDSADYEQVQKVVCLDYIFPNQSERILNFCASLNDTDGILQISYQIDEKKFEIIETALTKKDLRDARGEDLRMMFGGN